MTLIVLAFVIVQAALLLWASVRLSEVFMRPDKAAQAAFFAGTFLLPLAIAWWGRNNDPHRILCGWGDCVALVLSVAFVRFWAVSKEEEQWLLEREIARQVAIDRFEAARRAQDEEKIRSIATGLATSKTEAAQKSAAPLPLKPGAGSTSSPGGALRAAAPKSPPK